MTVRSGELIREFGLESMHLLRWRREGLITPIADAGYGHAEQGGAEWPDWTRRMIALIAITNRPKAGDRTDSGSDVLRSVAQVLARCPDVPWIVLTDDDAVPVWDSTEVVARVRGHVSAVVVSPPPLAEVAS